MKIQILMSTYNGEKYIRTQLDSIIGQQVERKELLIRDDGSTDNTVEIIQEYLKRYPWIKFYQGPNVGVRKSFMELIANADSDAEFVALADQDDQWDSMKLSRAIECLKKMNQELPLLYCSDKIIVDRNLEPINTAVNRKVRRISFGNALVQNICTGCTSVMNHNLVRLLCDYCPVNPDEMIMHDWWIYLTATCFGEVFYDTKTFIRYRQHGDNAMGAMINKRSLFAYRLKQLTKPRGEIFIQVKAFEKCFRKAFEIMDKWEEQRMICKMLLADGDMINRIKLMLDLRFYRQKVFDDIIFRGIVLLGKL